MSKTYAECKEKLASRDIDGKTKLIFEWTKTGQIGTAVFSMLVDDLGEERQKEKQRQIDFDTPD